MAIQQTKKQSDLEKRLKLLRQSLAVTQNKFLEVARDKQVYDNQSSVINPLRRDASYQLPRLNQDDRRQHARPSDVTTESYSDITYLRHDLMKISLLAGAALGIQVVLFFLLKNHIVNLKF